MHMSKSTLYHTDTCMVLDFIKILILNISDLIPQHILPKNEIVSVRVILTTDGCFHSR